MGIVITEALAEIKTIAKRIEKKRATIGTYLARQEGAKDPLEKDGGTPAFLKREMQAVEDLEERIVALRRAIQRANDATPITIHGATRTISNWLVWRREIAPGRARFLNSVKGGLDNLREQAIRERRNVFSGENESAKATDYVINIDEGALIREIENIEDILGTLDGRLSLANATVTLDID